MSFDYLVDSYAWVEYYIGTEKGARIKSILETRNIATSVLAIAELSDKFARENKDFNELFKFINSRSRIIPLTAKIAINSGKFKAEMRKKFKQFGLADAIIYLTAKSNNCKLLTGDWHFKGLNGVEFME